MVHIACAPVARVDRGGCLIIAFGAWMFILRNTRLSISFPATALTYIGIIIGSRLLFGESLSLIHYAGVALIVLGVVFLRGAEGWDDDA